MIFPEFYAYFFTVSSLFGCYTLSPSRSSLMLMHTEHILLCACEMRKKFFSLICCVSVSLCKTANICIICMSNWMGGVSTIWQLYHYIIVGAAAAAIIHIIFIWIELSFLLSPLLPSSLPSTLRLIQSRTIKPFTVSLNKRKHGVLYFKQLIYRTNFCAIQIGIERGCVCMTTVICDAIQCDMSGNVHYSNR